MPYRSAPPLSIYELRTSWMSVGVAGIALAVALGVVSLGSLAFLPSFDWLVVLAAVLVAGGYVASLRNEMVVAGRAEVRLYAGHVEVPRPFFGAPIRLPLDTLEVTHHRIEGRVMFQTVSAVEVLFLKADGKRRGLSSRLFANPAQLRELMEDLQIQQRGGALPSRNPLAPSPPPPPDEYDERLDEELDGLD